LPGKSYFIKLEVIRSLTAGVHVSCIDPADEYIRLADAVGGITIQLGPSSPTRSLRVAGPRELLSTTSYPAATAIRATVPPMFPLPMKPTVVIPLVNPRPPRGVCAPVAHA
jgi:hypothetical protein